MDDENDHDVVDYDYHDDNDENDEDGDDDNNADDDGNVDNNNSNNLFIYSALFNKRITTINNLKTIQKLEVYKYI